MAPQRVGDYFNSSSSSGVQYAQEYGNAMTDAARKYQTIILGAWASSTVLIFTQRLLRQEKPFEVNVAGKKLFSIPQPGILPAKYVQKLDDILFTLNYTLLSFLMVLQFLNYGKVTTQ